MLENEGSTAPYKTAISVGIDYGHTKFVMDCKPELMLADRSGRYYTVPNFEECDVES